MKIFTITAFICLTGITIAKCQTTPSSLSNYPLSVVTKVNDVSSAVNLPVERQLALANFFQKEMKQMAAAIQADSTGKQAMATKTSLRVEFESLLTPAELHLYSAKKKGATYAKPNFTGGSPVKATPNN